MVSVERILEYTNLPPEGDPKRAVKISKEWPQRGEIIFDHVSLRYAADLPHVLHDVSFVIKPSDKVNSFFNELFLIKKIVQSKIVF